MRTNIMKNMAEIYKDDYEEYVNICKGEPMDIWSWLAMEIATAEEYVNDAARDDALTEGENNA